MDKVHWQFFVCKTSLYNIRNKVFEFIKTERSGASSLTYSFSFFTCLGSASTVGSEHAEVQCCLLQLMWPKCQNATSPNSHDHKALPALPFQELCLPPCRKQTLTLCRQPSLESLHPEEMIHSHLKQESNALPPCKAPWECVACTAQRGGRQTPPGFQCSVQL